MRNFLLFASFAVLGACSGNPLDKLVKLSDVNVAEDAVSVAVAEAIGDTADKPLPDDAVDEIVEAAVTPVADPAPKAGFFARLLQGPTAPEEELAVAEAVAAPEPDVVPAVAVVDTAAADVPPAIDVPAPKQAGFFGRLFGGAKAAPATDATPEVTEAAVVTNAPAPRAGLFSPPARTGPDAQMVSVGTQIPYGEIATNCDVSRRQLGTKVGEASGYTLYDTIPNATAPRTHYITGFKDRCARQFTAATTLFGDIGTHEVVRYLPSNRRMPYTATDTAYEKLKGSYCGVGTRQPCGRKLDRFARNTTFVTAYRNFGSNPTWSNILLHNGQVVEMGSAAP